MKDYLHMPGWRLNKSDNKPAIKHSILMLTTHGVAEGEWNGHEWIQYRWSAKVKDSDVHYWLYFEDLTQLEKEGDSLHQERPEPYFYCKYGGTIPLCSDCKRNHSNSSFKTEEITTWYAPSNGTKHCVDYIQKEQSEIDLEKEIDMFFDGWSIDEDLGLVDDEGWSVTVGDIKNVARHFYELGQREMRNRISNPEYNKQVIDKMKSEYPIAANEEELKKAIKERYPMPKDADAHTRDRIAAARNGFLSGYSYELDRNTKKQ